MRKSQWFFTLTLIASVIAWLPTLQNYFIYDDWSIFSMVQDIVEGNISLHSFFLNEHFSLVLILIKYIEIYLFRLNYNWHFFFQLCLFLSSGAILRIFLKNIFKENIASILTFLFIINPAFFELVGWGAAQGFVLAFMFTVSSLLCFNKYLGKGDIIYYILGLIFILFSSLTSGVGYLSAAYVLLYYLVIKKEYKNIKLEFKREIKLLTPIIIVLLFLGFLSVFFLSHKYFVITNQSNFNPYAIMRFSILGFLLGDIVPIFGGFSIDRPLLGKLLYPNNLFFLIFSFTFLAVLGGYFYHEIIRKGRKIFELFIQKNFRIFCFSLTVILVTYIFTTIPRTWVGVESFIYFGRYHLFPTLGLLLLVGLLLSFLEEKIKKDNLKILSIILLLTILFLIQTRDITKINYFYDEESKQFSQDYFILRNNALLGIKIDDKYQKLCSTGNERNERMWILENIITFGKPKIIISKNCDYSNFVRNLH